MCSLVLVPIEVATNPTRIELHLFVRQFVSRVQMQASHTHLRYTSARRFDQMTELQNIQRNVKCSA